MAPKLFKNTCATVCGSLLALALFFSLPRPLTTVRAQAPDELTYTTAQAERGRAVYAEQCASCHGPNLDDGAFAPPLTGLDFRTKWGQQSAEPLFTYTATRMPPNQPGSLGDARYTDLMAFILLQNGSPAGSRELLTDTASLKTMPAPRWPRPMGGGLTRGVSLPPPPPRPNPLDRITPVTDAMLTRPPEGEWLSWRRTYDAYGFSPLKKINRANVKELRVAWSWALPIGVNQTAPLVHDGVMFVYGNGDKVQAFNAVTGDLLWQYDRRLPTGVAPSSKRSISIYGMRLYVPTSDAHIVALDVKTGKPVWDRPVADPQGGYGITGGTIVARGKVMVGTTGRAPGGNYIVALDAETGKEAWRVSTIARPGEPGGHTWNDIPLEARSGGSVWIPGSYDAVHNLALFGPGNTYDTLPLRDKVNKPGVTNDGLYLDTTLAINPETGKIVWYFQHQANGQWDLDWAFERQVVELPVNGTTQRVVVTAGKQMIFDYVEAETGRYLTSTDLGREAGVQNVVTAIDPKTGAKIVDQSLVPGDGQTKMVCPHVEGGRDWMPTSLDVSTKILYVPWVEACMDMSPVVQGERGMLTTGVRWTIRPRDGNDGKYGRLQAIDLETKKTLWVERQRAPLSSGALATAGGLVFVGGLDRMFSAHDARTGARLWQVRLNDVPASVPMSYAVGGQEHIAVIAGAGNPHTLSYNQLVPEFKNPPGLGTTLWVFEVPAQ
jgi:alcohol dehydrogenase (cytochrome c)